eukprot:GEMP01001293.1.p1 GENE.GEMP01001293.1~~GEMP01001293.1.p1  ORF type:complete len:1534 (+),score=257.94 GEMP01001293.1:277-4878(+)
MAKITRKSICLCVVLTVVIIICVSVGVGLVLRAPKAEESNKSKAQSAYYAQESTATSIVKVDGFEMTKSTKCDLSASCKNASGCGINASSYTNITVAACSDRCLKSTKCRSFEFAPKKDAYCVLYEHTAKSVSSMGAESACYLRMASNINVHSSSDFSVIAKQPEDQEVDLALQCVEITPSFDKPDVAKLALMEADIINQARKAQEVELSQSDFNHGTFLITKPGYYKLREDIEIRYSEDPTNTTSPYHYGWTTGIAISAEQNVVIDLNGKTMKMSAKNHRQMRFFNMIQLNDKIFPSGFARFTGDLVSAARVVIFSSARKPGVLKQITHFGIAGIRNTDIVIRNLRVESFEVGGISLADVRNVFIKDVDIDNTDLVVRWEPYFYVMGQLRRRLHQLVAANGKSTAEGQRWQSKLDFVDDKLRNGEWIASANRDLAPGNLFGLQLKATTNPKDVGGKMVHIKDVTVKHIHSGPSEVVAVRNQDHVIQDMDLNVFEWDDFLDSTGKIKTCYAGDERCENKKKINAIRMDVTLALEANGSAAHKGVSALRREIEQMSKGDQATTDLKPTGGADGRGHVPKGAFGIRLVGLEDAVFENVDVANVRSFENTGVSTGAMLNHHESPILWRGAKNAQKVFKGNNAQGIFGQRSRNIMLENVAVREIESVTGSVIGVGFGDKSRNVIFKDVFVSLNPRESESPSTKIPNIIPVVVPFYAEEDHVDCFRFIDIVDSLHDEDKPRLFIAPVVDCASTEAKDSNLCAAIDIPPTSCPTTPSGDPTCSTDGGTVGSLVQQTTCDYHSLEGTGQVMCRNRRVQLCAFTDAIKAAACCATDLGLWKCPSDLHVMCKVKNGVHYCAHDADGCENYGGVAMGSDCPISAQFGGGSFTPNCPVTLDSDIPADGNDMYLTCRNGSVCPVHVDTKGIGSGWDCCTDSGSDIVKGGRLKCPPSFPYMCEDRVEMCGGGDHCCAISSLLCERDFSGLLSDTDEISTNDCVQPLSAITCTSDSDCPYSGQTCDGSKCTGYARCANPTGKQNTTTLCVNHETCQHTEENGNTCCSSTYINSQVYQCPLSAKYLCHARSCRGDHCCVKYVRDCDDHGGLRDPDSSTDGCPVATPLPPTCVDFGSCVSSQYIPNPTFVCTKGSCAQSDCCKDKPTCVSVGVRCGPLAARRDSFVCSDSADTSNCRAEVCCLAQQKCHSHKCTLKHYVVPTERQEIVCSGLDVCDDDTCCVPTCQSVFSTDKSCHAAAAGTLVNPKQKMAQCARTSCTALLCCMETCAMVDCNSFGAPGSNVPNPNAPHDCGSTGNCSVDTCCRPTCSTHTCSSTVDEAGIPITRKTRQCANSQCTDEECCTPVCAHYFRPSGSNICKRGSYMRDEDTKLLCSENSFEACAYDCCVWGAFKGAILSDDDDNLSSTLVIPLTLFSIAGVLVCCVCALASWTVIHAKRKDEQDDKDMGLDASDISYHRAAVSSPRNVSTDDISATFDDNASRSTRRTHQSPTHKRKKGGKGEQRGGNAGGKGAGMPYVAGASYGRQNFLE